MGIIAGLAALWIGCVWIEGGSEYINNLLVKQTVGRAVNAFTHAKPFWFYLVAIIWCLAPYSLLLVGTLPPHCCRFGIHVLKRLPAKHSQKSVFLTRQMRRIAENRAVPT